MFLESLSATSITNLKTPLMRLYGKFTDLVAKKYLARHGLLSKIENLRSKYKTTGADYVDYMFLDAFIKRHRPRRFLECGTGITTHVIADAMSRYCYDRYGSDMKLISMESVRQWYDEALDFLPDQHKEFLSLHYTPISTFEYAFFKRIGHSTPFALG